MTKIRKNEVVTVYQVKNSINALEKEVALLTIQYDKLSKEERENAAGKEMQQKIHDLNKEIREQRVLLSNMKANVGNYRDSLNGLSTVSQRVAATFVDWRMKIAAFSAAISGTVYTMWRWVKMNASLSDSMAAVRRTTEMTNQEVFDLNRTFRSFDTRTSQQSLLDLAHVAGKLGIAKQDIAGFVKGADMIGVALGKDIGNNEEAINQLGRIVQLFKLNEGGVGMERALLKTGSALKDLGNASVAEEVNIIDFTKRLGGIAPIAKISADKIMALGATYDILGQTTEVASTATNQIWVNMAQHPEKFAKIAGMKIKDFTTLMKKDFNEAFIAVAKGLQKNEGGWLELAKQFEGLGTDGRRVIAVMSALSGSTDLYREQMKIAKESYEAGSTAAKQFAIQNETLGAQLDKAIKALKNSFANEGAILTFIGVIRGLANAWYYLGEAMQWAGKIASVPINLVTGNGTGLFEPSTDPKVAAYQKADLARKRKEDIDVKTMGMLPAESQKSFVKKHQDLATSYLHLWEKAKEDEEKTTNKFEKERLNKLREDYATRYSYAKQHADRLASMMSKEAKVTDLTGKSKEDLKREKAIEDAYKRLEKQANDSQKRMDAINKRADAAIERSYQLRVEMGIVSLEEQEQHELSMLDDRIKDINKSATDELKIQAKIDAEKNSWTKKQLDETLKRIEDNQDQQTITFEQAEEMRWGIYLKYAKLRGAKDQETVENAKNTMKSLIESIENTSSTAEIEVVFRITEEKNTRIYEIQDQLQNRQITIQEYKRREKEINEEYDRQIMQTSIKYMEETIKKLKEIGAPDAKIFDLEQKLAELRIALSNKVTGVYVENAEKRKQAEEQAMQEIKRMSLDLLQEIGNLWSQTYSNQIAAIDEKIDKNREMWDVELEAANGNEQIEKQINSRRSAEEKKLNKERKKAMAEQAEAQKMIGAVQIVVNTAIGATAQFQAGPAGIALAALVIALGAVQLATLLSANVPQYAKGRKDGPAEIAITGEKGSEMIRTKDGRSYFTPDHPTLTYLPAGAEVVPHDKTVKEIEKQYLPYGKTFVSEREFVSFSSRFTTPDITNRNHNNVNVTVTNPYGMEMLNEMRKKKTEPRVINTADAVIYETGNYRLITRK